MPPLATWSQLDKYLKPQHFNRKPVTLTILSVLEQELHPKPGIVETSPVLYFKETPKGLILSPTNRKALAELFGDDVSQCVGQCVRLALVEIDVAGKKQTPIRISAAPAKAKAANGEKLTEGGGPGEGRPLTPTEPPGDPDRSPTHAPADYAQAVHRVFGRPKPNHKENTPAKNTPAKNTPAQESA